MRAVTEPVQMATLGGGHRTRQKSCVDVHNLIGDPDACPELCTTMIELRTPQGWGYLPNDTTKLHHNGIWLRGDHNRLGRPSTQEEQAQGYQAPKSNKLLNFTSTYHRGELKPMHQMQWQGHTECPSPSLPNPTKATNAREGNERKNKKENTKNSKIKIQGVPLT